MLDTLHPRVPWNFIEDYVHWSKDLALLTAIYPSGMHLHDLLSWRKRFKFDQHARYQGTSCLEGIHWLAKVLGNENFQRHATEIFEAFPLEIALIHSYTTVGNTRSPWDMKTLSFIVLYPHLPQHRENRYGKAIVEWAGDEARNTGSSAEFALCMVESLQSFFKHETGDVRDGGFLRWLKDLDLDWHRMIVELGGLDVLDTAFSGHGLQMEFHVVCLESMDPTQYSGFLKQSKVSIDHDWASRMLTFWGQYNALDPRYDNSTHTKFTTFVDVYFPFVKV